MARPITWTDVAYRGNAALVETYGRAADRVTDAIKGIGQVAVDNRNQQIEKNTKDAVASILTSDDPDAAVAAAPQGWQYDPLAIAKAGSAREKELTDAKVADASLRANNLQADMAQAGLDDRVAQREGADLALPYRDLIFSGKGAKIDRTDPRWQTAAGREAIKLIDGWDSEFRDFSFKQKELGLRQAEASLRIQEAKEGKALRDANSELVRLSGTAEFLAKPPEERDRIITQVYDKHGAPLTALTTGRAAVDLGMSGNKPTDAELDAINPQTGTTTRALVENISQRALAVDARTNQDLSRYDTALRGAELMANNPYKGLSDGEAAQLFLKNNPQVGNGVLTRDWGPEDVKDRADRVQKEAKKAGKPITREQAFMLVEGTIGEMTPFDSVGIFNDRVKANLEEFGALNDAGGVDKVNADIAAVKAAGEKAKAKLGTEYRLAEASARNPNIAPKKETVLAYQSDPTVRRNSLNAQITLMRNNIAQLGPQVNAGKVNASVLTDMTKQLTKLQAELDALK